MLDVIEGDCREWLDYLPAKSFHTCVTSPPYFQLRDYEHPDQLGAEDAPADYVAALVGVFDQVRRVLRDDGTLWLNLGDSYSSRPNGSVGKASRLEGSFTGHDAFRRAHGLRKSGVTPGRKHKDLIGIPWLVAFALQANGWYLRQEIIWNKPNTTPESVKDRCTKSHETVFLLSKRPRYYFDQLAIAEPLKTDPRENYPARSRIVGRGTQSAAGARIGGEADRDKSGGFKPLAEGLRNRRTVWTIPTRPSGVKHFASFPVELAADCLRAGAPVGGSVLDPFGGIGTTALAAGMHGRNATIIELNPGFAAMARERLGL